MKSTGCWGRFMISLSRHFPGISITDYLLEHEPYLFNGVSLSPPVDVNIPSGSHKNLFGVRFCYACAIVSRHLSETNPHHLKTKASIKKCAIIVIHFNENMILNLP